MNKTSTIYPQRIYQASKKTPINLKNIPKASTQDPLHRPNHLLWLICFYLIFHSCLNTLGEVTWILSFTLVAFFSWYISLPTRDWALVWWLSSWIYSYQLGARVCGPWLLSWLVERQQYPKVWFSLVECLNVSKVSGILTRFWLF